MKIAIVALNWMNIGGALTWTIDCYNIFNRFFGNTDVFTINGSGRRSKHDDYIPEMKYLNYRKYKNELDDYDLVYFTTMGHYSDKKFDEPFWYNILFNLHTPFVVGVLSQWEKKIYAKYEYFVDTPFCIGIQYISEAVKEEFLQDELFKKKDCFIGDWADIRKYDISSKYHKDKLIISTSRVMSTKGIDILFRDFWNIIGHEFNLEVYGVIPYFSYKDTLKEILGPDAAFDFIYKGEYKIHNIPDIMRRAMYHFEYVQTKKIDKSYQLNYTTLEAMMYGVVPIMNRKTAPVDIIDGVNAILIDKDESWVHRIFKIREHERIEIIENNEVYFNSKWCDSNQMQGFCDFIYRNKLSK